MITVKHPDDECNQQQEALLAQLPPSQRRAMELMFIHGNISYRYHRWAGEFQPTEEDWREWLAGLPKNIQEHTQRKGFEESKKMLSFSRYVMEKNDVGMEEYVRKRMGEADYAEYMALLNDKK
jgi:hypothetical protein